MKSKIYQIALFSFEMICLSIIFIVCMLFTVASISNMLMSKRVKDFIDSATFEREMNDIRYYSVECDDLDEETIVIKEPDGRFFESPDLGTAGDIYVMPQSRIEYFPMLSSFISYLFGGHAGVITENQMLVEAMGGTSEEGYVYWYNTDLLREERTVIGLRVDAPIEDRKQASSNAMSLIGKKYNYWFIFNTKDKYYCMDICSRIYSKQFGLDYKLDSNGFHVTVQDLFHNKNTKISFVKYIHGDKTYIYYLKKSNK